MEIRRLERASSRKRIPIIALTANAMAQDRQDCLNAGMDDHLAKPLSRVQMQEMLNRWMPIADQTQPSGLTDSPLTLPVDIDVIDKQVLSQLRELQHAEDPDLLNRVITIYLAESPKIIAKMKQAVQQGSLIETERMSHSLKSSSANVGATALSALCSDIYLATRAGHMGVASDSMMALELEFARAKSALKAEMKITA